MEFVCEKNIMLKNMEYVMQAVAMRSTMTILQNFLIEVDKEKGLLTITGTDLEIWIKSDINCEVIKAGVTTANAKQIIDIIKAFSDNDNIRFILNDDRKLLIKSNDTGRSLKYTIVTVHPDDYPQIKDEYSGSGIEIELNQNVLRNGIKNTIYAVSRDDTRYVLTGCLLEYKEDNVEGYIKDKINIVATCGRRLAKSSININTDLNGKSEFSLIIPSKILHIVSKVLGNDGDTKIIFTENKIMFNIGNVKISGVILEGQFPDYKKVIPENNKNTISIDRLKLLESIKSVKVVEDKASNKLILKIYGKENKLYLSSSNSDADGNCELQILDCILEDVNEIEFLLNSDFVLDSIKNLDDNRVKIKFDGSSSPVVIIGECDENIDNINIIMPMRV